MPARMPRITLLGRLAIERDAGADPAALPGRRSELVFAYLAAEHRRTVSRDELADALWPGVLPDSWAAGLRTVVSEVRRFLERAGLDASEMLVSASGGYQLRLPARIVVDLDEARAALAAARDRLSDGDALAAAERSARAGELARLPFLPHHDGDWVDGVRKELEAMHVAALELELRARRQAGDARSAAAAADRLVHAEPFSESAHRLRIELLAESGDRAGAMRAYEHCRAVLTSELGIEPSAETQSVLRRALGTPAAHAAAAVDAALPGASSVMVVEDHDFQRRTAVGLLRRLGVRTVLEAPDGEAALELLAVSPAPDVIIVDIGMPGMDGVELIRHVSERGLANAVVIVSGLDRRLVQAVAAVSEGYGLQVLGAVEKPITARNLSALLAGYRPPSPPQAAERHAVDVSEELESGRIVAHLQPIVDLGTGRITAAEVVPRLDHHAAGARPTAVDLAPASGSGELAGRFGDHMLRLLCSIGADLARAGMPIDLSLRVPGAGPMDGALADRVSEVVRIGGGEPRRIVLVVGERVVRADAPAALDGLTRLRAKGFGVWLDGFDGGRTAAQRLERVPLTGLRLAPRLVAGAAGDARRVPALQEMLDVALAMGLPVVGAGCESAAEFELLLQLGCGHAQGTFVAEAMPPRELADWAARWTPPPVVEASA